MRVLSLERSIESWHDICLRRLNLHDDYLDKGKLSNKMFVSDTYLMALDSHKLYQFYFILSPLIILKHIVIDTKY